MKMSKLILGSVLLVFLSCNENRQDQYSEEHGTVAMTANLTKEVAAADEIGYLNGNNKFHFKSASIKDQVELEYESVVKIQGFTVDFENFVFTEASNNNGYSMLEANGVDKSGTTVNTARGVTVNAERKVFTDPNQTTVTCTGCRRGCNPRRDSNGDGYCTDCKISNSNCTKTETL